MTWRIPVKHQDDIDAFREQIRIYTFTPQKNNMEPKNHPNWKGKSSSKPSFSGSMLIFQGAFATGILGFGNSLKLNVHLR